MTTERHAPGTKSSSPISHLPLVSVLTGDRCGEGVGGGGSRTGLKIPSHLNAHVKREHVCGGVWHSLTVPSKLVPNMRLPFCGGVPPTLPNNPEDDGIVVNRSESLRSCRHPKNYAVSESFLHHIR
jgi:hypothetical protein